MSTDPASEKWKSKRKQSIATVTNMLLVLFISLVLLLIGFTYNQLNETRTSFKTIATDVVPTLANNGIIHSQLSSLAFLVANFAQADSAAQLRISEAEVTTQLTEIERLTKSSSIDIETDLTLIKAEFDVLKDLIEELFSLQQILIDGESQIYAIQSRLEIANVAKRYEQTEILISALRLIHTTKLIDVRRLQRTMEAQLNRTNAEKNANTTVSQSMSTKVNELVFGDRGIIDSKLLLLRTKGRVEGQRNFVRRLVLDVASEAEFKAYNFASNQSEQAELLATRSSQQFSITLSTYIVTFLIGLALMIFVKIRVVSRLEVLTQSLNHDVKPEKIEHLYSQNDEISILAQTAVEHIETIDKQKAKLTLLSFMDGLTKVGNRRAFNERIQQSANLAMRNNLNLSVLLIDVDCFKQFNDEYGHIKGDECLQHIAQTISESAKRGSDFVARYGGEEFVCLLVGMPASEALEFASGLCKTIEELAIPHSKSTADADVVTVSIGVHTESEITALSEERLLQCADTALYQAKTNGRNQAVQYLN